MGVEGRNLYTADVTRTLPIDGTFALQRELYDLVHAAQDRHPGRAARRGLPRPAPRRDGRAREPSREWGMLPVSAEEALEPEGEGLHGRWTLHGTSHMLGMDVHDCAPPAEAYAKGNLAEGMVLTVEPGLYFQRTTCSSPRGCAGSASGSRTTSWSPPTAAGSCPPRCPPTPTTSRVDGLACKPANNG